MVKKCIRQLLDLCYPPVKRFVPFDVFAYLVTGAANTLFNIVLFVVLYQLFQPRAGSVEVATALAFIATLITGYWLQSNFAFRQNSTYRVKKSGQFARYALVSVQGQFSAYILTKSFIALVGLDARPAYLITTVIMLTVNYFLQKYFTFRSRKVSV